MIFEILTTLVAALGDPVAGAPTTSDWTPLGLWRQQGSYLVNSSESQTIPSQCAKSPESHLVTPILIQGTQRLFLDGILVAHSGLMDGIGSTMNNILVISCQELKHGKVLTWQVSTETRPLAKLTSYPQLHEQTPIGVVLARTIPPTTAILLFVLGVTLFTLFHTTDAGNKVNVPFLLANVLVAAHFALTVPEAFGIKISATTLHKLHDVVLWTGMCFLWVVFRIVGLAPRNLQKAQAWSGVVSVAIILIAQDLSQSQVGSTIAFLSNILMCTAAFFRAASHTRRNANIHEIYKLLAVTIFCLSGTCDLLTHLGVWDILPTYAAGYVGSTLMLAVLINQEIAQTYRERDSLRLNLEKKVEEKTEILTRQTQSLEKAYEDLKAAKADAIQAAKLASLGTLSAGIAHEINNSLNYVNGSLPPLRKILAKDVLEAEDKRRSERLLGLMQEGLDLTFEIIRNLKSHASSSNKEIEPLKLRSLIDGTLLLLKSKVNNSISVAVEIDASLCVLANQTGLTQVSMNILSNAVDALNDLPEGRRKSIRIYSEIHEEKIVCLKIHDNGPGIPEDTLSRIFDPFFTTKPEGKGTGLGLYIVRNEIQKMGGAIQVRSDAEHGTEFSISLPLAGVSLSEGQAA